ncbi:MULTISPECIES: Lrp/AsnC ligand binding domain-containing protein [Sphingobium]|jgi:hypothetical protein|uniref:Lrp/AsnC ligand binding domain-containing protein n=1 Tax=Sphingobium TaxID=165695 RepID=UPI001FE4CC0C|nr:MULTISPECIES: Lrp/AsnC ligand binding domain-containing protein [Sphingobium]WDA39264.1 Lrp/AsnC ligand binding domain-containing protein [Sphingobium sp. YC-XJ3]
MSGDSDYVLRVVVPTIDDYEHFLKKVVVHLLGLASVNSSFALKSVKVPPTCRFDRLCRAILLSIWAAAYALGGWPASDLGHDGALYA